MTTTPTVPCNGVHPDDIWAPADLAASGLPTTLCTRPGRRTGPLEHPVVGRHPLLVLSDESSTRGGSGDPIRIAARAVVESAMTSGENATATLSPHDPRYPDLTVTAAWPLETP